MDKITYLAELAEGLARWVPTRERQDILRWYAEYFEEAGPEREAEVIAELGDPWALSCRLAVEGGYVTQEKAASWTPRKKRTRVLIGTAVGLAVFALVFGIGLLAVNVMRVVTDRAWRSAVISQSVPGTVADWGREVIEGEYNVAFVDDPGAMGFFYADGGDLEDFGSIDVDISLGNIQVVAGDSFTLSVGKDGALSGYEPTWEVTNGVLKLRDGNLSQGVQVDNWDDLKNLFRMNYIAMDVTITVPDHAALDRISVKTGLGNVSLWGVGAKTVTVETGVGQVDCYEAWNAQRLELTTGVGDVILGMSEVGFGADIRLESGTGNVEVDLACSESDCRYDLESGLGLVTVDGAVRGGSTERKGGAVCSLDAESGTGNVSVYFNS